MRERKWVWYIYIYIYGYGRLCGNEYGGDVGEMGMKEYGLSVRRSGWVLRHRWRERAAGACWHQQGGAAFVRQRSD